MTARRADASAAELFAEHLADLRKSGLSDETIAAMQVRSLTAGELAKAVGYVPHRAGCRPDRVGSALAIPYPVLEFERYKLFPPGIDKDGKEQRYAQGKGSGVHLYVLPAVRGVLTEASVPLFWTEGEKKAAKATQEGFHCIGMGGLWNFLEAGTANGIAELYAIMHVKREELIVPDSDVWTRPDLLPAVYAFGKELEARGARVSVVVIPAGENGAKVGLDDYLVARGFDAFRTLPRIGLKDPAFTKQKEWYPQWKASRTRKTPTGTAQGQALTLADPEPWPEPVDGAELLSAIIKIINKYLVLPPGGAITAALWILHTYVVEVLFVTPILLATSPKERCGKTRLFEVLQPMCRRALAVSGITAPVLFRTVDAFRPSLLIDEADTYMVDNEALRGVINAGNTRSTAWFPRCVGDDNEPRMFSAFCARAIAAIGKLPRTIEDRGPVLRMRRKTKDEKTTPFRADRIDAECEPLRRKAARWAQDHLCAIKECDPEVPDVLNDRAADFWRPLLAIADAAGGDWPKQARQAAVTLSGAAVVEDDDVKVQLLSDIRDAFNVRRDAAGGVGAPYVEKIATETLLQHLHGLTERPWPEWGKRRKPLTDRGLGGLLDPFGIKSKTVRLGPHETDTAKGYDRADFEKTFSSYLPDEKVTASQTAPDAGFGPLSHPSQDGGRDGSENETSACSDASCDAVTDRNQGHREGCECAAYIVSVR